MADDFQDEPPPGGEDAPLPTQASGSPDAGNFQDEPPPGGQVVPQDSGGYQDEPPPGGETKPAADQTPWYSKKPKDYAPTILQNIGSAAVSGLGEGTTNVLRGAAALMDPNANEENSWLDKAASYGEAATKAVSGFIGGDPNSWIGGAVKPVASMLPVMGAATGAALAAPEVIGVSALVASVLGLGAAAGVGGLQSAGTAQQTAEAFNATPEDKATYIRETAALGAAMAVPQVLLAEALGPLAGKAPGLMGYLRAAMAEGAGFTSVSEVQKAAQAYVDRSTGVNPDAQYSFDPSEAGQEFLGGAIIGAGSKAMHAYPGRQADPQQTAADQNATQADPSSSNAGSPSLGTAATAVPPDTTNADPLKASTSAAGKNQGGFHVGTGEIGREGAKRTFAETPDEDESTSSATGTAKVAEGMQVVQPGGVTPEITRALSETMTSPEEKAPEATSKAPEAPSEPPSAVPTPPVEPPPPAAAPTPKPPDPLPAPPDVQPPPKPTLTLPNRPPVTPDITQQKILRRQQARQQRLAATETPSQEPAGASEAPRGPEIAQRPEAPVEPPKAAPEATEPERNNVAPTTPTKTQALSQKVIQDRLALEMSRLTRAEASGDQGAIAVQRNKVNTLQGMLDRGDDLGARTTTPTEAPRVLPDLTKEDMPSDQITHNLAAMEPEKAPEATTRNQKAGATSDRNPVYDGRGNHVSNEESAIKALDRTSSYTMADKVADERPFPDDINPQDPADRARLKQYAQDFMADLNGRTVEADDPRKANAGQKLTLGWSAFKGMRPKDPNHAGGQLLAQELARVANKKGPVSPEDALQLMGRAAVIKGGRAGEVRQERSQEARDNMVKSGQIKEAAPTEEGPRAVMEGMSIAPTSEGRAEAAKQGVGEEGQGQEGQTAKIQQENRAEALARQGQLRALRDRFNLEQKRLAQAQSEGATDRIALHQKNVDDLGQQVEAARLASGGKPRAEAEPTGPLHADVAKRPQDQAAYRAGYNDATSGKPANYTGDQKFGYAYDRGRNDAFRAQDETRAAGAPIKSDVPETSNALTRAWEEFKKTAKGFGEDEEGGVTLPSFFGKGAKVSKGVAEAWNNIQTRHSSLLNTDHLARALKGIWKQGTDPARDFANHINKWAVSHTDATDRLSKALTSKWLDFADKNPQEAAKVGNLMQNEVLGRGWADLPWAKRFQGRVAENRVENAWKKEQHGKNAADYAALTSEGRSMRAHIYNTIDAVNREIGVKRANDILEREGVNSPGLAERVADNQYSPQDIATRGQEKLDQLREASHPHADGSPYLPFIREGDHFVLARTKLTDPTKGVTRDLSDKATGKVQWEFKDRADAEDYAKSLGHDAPATGYVVDKATGERTYQTTDPTTGATTTHSYTAEDLKSDTTGRLEKRYAVTARGDGRAKTPNGDVHAPFDHVEAFRTKHEADARKAELLAGGDHEDAMYQRRQYQKAGGMADILNMMGENGDKALNKNPFFVNATPHQQAAMRDAMHQGMLAIQGGNRTYNPKMRRSGVAGYNKDMARSMDAYSRKAASAMTALDHLRPLQDALKEIDQQKDEAREASNAARKTNDDTGAAREAQRNKLMTETYNTLAPRLDGIFDHSMSPSQAAYGPALHRMLAWSSVKRLTHPSFWVQHAMQNAMFSPMTLMSGAKEHNLKGGAAAALNYFRQEVYNKDTNLATTFGRGLRQAYNNARGIDNGQKLSDFTRNRYTDPVQRKAFDELRDRGSIPNKPIQDAALTEDEQLRHGANLESIFGSAPEGTARGGLRTAAETAVNASDDALHVIQHVFEPTVNSIETHNRASTAMAAFRHHYDTYGDFDKALDYAHDQTTLAHANYQRFNKPAWEQWASRVPILANALQFKTFAAMSYDHLFKSMANLSTPGQRAAGGMLAGGLIATHLLMAGAFGLPFEEPLRVIADTARAAGLTKKSWDDLQEMALQAVHSATGSKSLAQAFTHGMPNLMGLDLNPQLGEHGLLPSLGDTGKERDLNAAREDFAFNMFGGSSAGMLNDVFKGTQQLVNGDPMGLATMAPVRVVNDIANAIKGYEEGKTNAKGKEQEAPYSLPEAIAKGSGFSLSRDTESSFASREAMVATNRASEAKSDLVNAVVANRKDPAARAVAWKAAMQAGIKPHDLTQAIVNEKKNESAKRNINDISVTKKTKPVVTPIANTLSGW